MELLAQPKQQRRERAEAARVEALDRLREAAHAILPGQAFYAYGSVLRPYGFHETSDVDIAPLEEPPHRSIYRVQSELMECLRRPVDVCLLEETRLRDKIVRQGERWTSYS